MMKDFSDEIMYRHISTIREQGVVIWEDDLKKLRDGWHTVAGYLASPKFEKFPDIFRRVSVLFLTLRQDDPEVRVVNCMGEFERRFEFHLLSLDEIPDYSIMADTLSSTKFVSHKDGRTFTPPA